MVFTMFCVSWLQNGGSPRTSSFWGRVHFAKAKSKKFQCCVLHRIFQDDLQSERKFSAVTRERLAVKIKQRSIKCMSKVQERIKQRSIKRMSKVQEKIKQRSIKCMFQVQEKIKQRSIKCMFQVQERIKQRSIKCMLQVQEKIKQRSIKCMFQVQERIKQRSIKCMFQVQERIKQRSIKCMFQVQGKFKQRSRRLVCYYPTPKKKKTPTQNPKPQKNAKAHVRFSIRQQKQAKTFSTVHAHSVLVHQKDTNQKLQIPSTQHKQLRLIDIVLLVVISIKSSSRNHFLQDLLLDRKSRRSELYTKKENALGNRCL